MMNLLAEVLNEMKISDNMVPFISSLLNMNIGTTITKRQLIAALYKITKKGVYSLFILTTSNYTFLVPEKLSNPVVWNNLLEYFKSNEKCSEKRLHMSVIKIYTLLNLASDRRIIPTTSLAYDPNLPQESDENSELVSAMLCNKLAPTLIF